MWQLFALIFCVFVYLLVTNNNKPPDIYNVQECAINIPRNSPYDPLVLQYTANSFRPQFPTQKIIRMTNNEEIYIGCPNGKLQTPIRTLNDGRFSCQSNTMFVSSDKIKVDFNDITCRSPVEVSSVGSNDFGNTCVEDYEETKVGYNIFKQFVPAYTVCYNEKSSVRVYSKTNLSKEIGSGHGWNSTRFVNNGGIHKATEKDMERLFTPSEQKIILGAQAEIDDRKFWTKGQLVSEADLGHRFQKEAAFHYNNVFPQWTENRGNWKDLEQSLRKNVSEEQKDATVFTGTFGEVRVNTTSLRLPVNSLLEQSLPIPKWIWKVVRVRGQAISNYVFFAGNYKDSPLVTEFCRTSVTAEVFLGNSWVGSKGKVGIFVCEIEFVVDEGLRGVLQKL